jgi:hypothetical protein
MYHIFNIKGRLMVTSWHTERPGRVVAFLPEVPNSNLFLDTGYPGRVLIAFRGVSRGIPG